MAGVDARGTQFGRVVGGTFTPIANITNISGPSRSRETIDVTTHDSPDGYMEFIGGLKDGGEISLELNYDPTETTHDLDADFESDVPLDYRIVLLPGTPDEHTWDFKGIITEIGDEFPYDDKMARSITIKVSGKPVLTATGGA